MLRAAEFPLMASYGEAVATRIVARDVAAHPVQWGASLLLGTSPVPVPALGEAFGRMLVGTVFRPAGAASAVIGPTHTIGSLSREDWYRTRHAAAVEYLTSRGMEPALAWWVAVALLGHWAHETGHGRAELDYALGNIRAPASWNGAVHYIQGSDDAAPAPYRAYTTLAEGVADSASLAIDGTRYRPAFNALVASRNGGPYVVTGDGRSVAFPIDVVQWYADLTRAGWHPYSEESQAI
jgi:hypothetical protein